MALEEYRRKRNFGKTPEPAARLAPRKRRKAKFVIQEHHARRLHYDFRLEIGGVLKSWAVPKEPTLDPKVRRLAVEVEDHPLDYADFEGTIPAGQYGGGSVAIWDNGTFSVEGDPERALERGKLDFTLDGRKLKGSFSLIRTALSGAKQNWLLLKRRDRFALGASVSGTERKPGRVVLSSLDKVMYPEIGATKADVLEYYRNVAPFLIPELKDRPITLERLPEGVGKGPHFWQKNTPEYYPDWIPRASLPSESGKKISYALVNNVETLLYLVNQGALTFHTWMSRIQDLDRPDYVLFDLDPGKSGFTRVVDIARELHGALKDFGLSPKIKTSGKSGLHLTVPWTQSGGYDEAREWALSVANDLVRECSKIATVARSKDRRQGKVYIDVLQNVKGHHAVPPYVLRPTPLATVSMPISARELGAKLDPRKFNIGTALRRIRSGAGGRASS